MWFYVQITHGMRLDDRGGRALPLSLTLVAATDHANAAARAYVKCVGRHRARRLIENGMPDEWLVGETDPRLVQQGLRRVGPLLYEMSNSFEFWRFRVCPLQMVDQIMARQQQKQWRRFHGALRYPPAN